MRTFQFSGNSDAKGRNGYFRLHSATYWPSATDPDSQVCHIDFLASRSSIVGPARLLLTLEDLHMLHSLIGQALRDVTGDTTRKDQTNALSHD